MSEDRKRILKMVEEGHLTVEEADELLDALQDAERVKEQEYTVENPLSEEVHWDEQESSHEESSERSKSTKHKIFDFVDEAIQKIKNVDFDLNFGSSVKVSHIFQYQDYDFSSLDFEVRNGSIQVNAWDEQEVRIECEAKIYTDEDEAEAKRQLLQELIVSFKMNTFTLMLLNKKIKADIVVYLPDHIYNKTDIETFNGPIHLYRLESKYGKVKTSNGKIDVDKIKGEEWDVKSVNGSIKIENSLISDLEVESITGSAQINGTFEKVDAQLVGGSIHCDWYGSEGRSGYFKSTTGSIRLHVPSTIGIKGELRSSIGNVKCTLPDYETSSKDSDFLKKQLHFQTDSMYGQFLLLEAESKTGSVTVGPLKG